MRPSRLLSLTLLVGLLSLLLVPAIARTEVSCYEIANCTVCTFWNGDQYAGHLKWCKPPAQ